MDKSWISKSRLSKEFIDGVDSFLNFAFAKKSQHGMISCPCYKCVNVFHHTREVVREHLVCNGFLSGYTCWVFHGERPPTSSSNLFSDVVAMSNGFRESPSQTQETGVDDINSLLENAFGMYNQAQCNRSPARSEVGIDQDPLSPSIGTPTANFSEDVAKCSTNSEAVKFFKCLENASVELYPGCTNYSKLSFVVHLFHMKCLNGMTGKAFTALLEFVAKVFPNAAIPKSTYEAKKMIKDLGLGYEKIHACINDCMLFWGDKFDQESCDKCGASRWIINSEDSEVNEMDDVNRKKIPAKVLRYFPLIPRLQRLFMSLKTSDLMRWHDER